MATGYTSIVGEGASFEEYVWRCARGFGALIHMRDDSMEAEINFEPWNGGDYHLTQLKRTIKELQKFQNLTDEALQKELDDKHQKALDYAAESKQRRETLLEKYDSMLSQVEAWEVPSSEHNGLRDFMISQLKESKEHDCRPYGEDPQKPSLEEFRASTMKSLLWSLEYHTKEYKRSYENYTGKVKWLKDLAASVPVKVFKSE